MVVKRNDDNNTGDRMEQDALALSQPWDISFNPESLEFFTDFDLQEQSLTERIINLELHFREIALGIPYDMEPVDDAPCPEDVFLAYRAVNIFDSVASSQDAKSGNGKVSAELVSGNEIDQQEPDVGRFIPLQIFFSNFRRK